MNIKNGAKLTVEWFDGEVDIFIYNSIIKLFTNNRREAFTTKELITEEDIAYHIEHLDDNFSTILDSGEPIIKRYELINN